MFPARTPPTAASRTSRSGSPTMARPGASRSPGPWNNDPSFKHVALPGSRRLAMSSSAAERGRRPAVHECGRGVNRRHGDQALTPANRLSRRGLIPMIFGSFAMCCLDVRWSHGPVNLTEARKVAGLCGSAVARPDGWPLRHSVALRKEQQSFRLEDERIENERPAKGKSKPYLFYHYGHGRPVINTVSGKKRQLNRDDVAPDASILAQRQDPESFPEITRLATVYDRIRLYREWTFGRNTVFREPQKSDLRTDRLEEDFSNLGMFLNRLRRQPKTKAALLAGLANLYEGLTDFDVSIEGGTVQVLLHGGRLFDPGDAAVGRHRPLPVPAGDPVRPGAAAADRHRGAGTRAAPGHLAESCRLTDGSVGTDPTHRDDALGNPGGRAHGAAGRGRRVRKA